MKKTKHKKTVRNPISKKVILALKKASARKVLDISEIREAKFFDEDLEKTIITAIISEIKFDSVLVTHLALKRRLPKRSPRYYKF